MHTEPTAVKQYITDKEGISDLKTIEDRKDEPVEDYEAYSQKRKPHLHV